MRRRRWKRDKEPLLESEELGAEYLLVTLVVFCGGLCRLCVSGVWADTLMRPCSGEEEGMCRCVCACVRACVRACVCVKKCVWESCIEFPPLHFLWLVNMQRCELNEPALSPPSIISPVKVVHWEGYIHQQMFVYDQVMESRMSSSCQIWSCWIMHLIPQLHVRLTPHRLVWSFFKCDSDIN